jgi:hypothetical protein
MPYQTQTEKNAAYIDVRFYLNRESESFTDDDGTIEEEYDHFYINKVERRKLKGISEEDADSLGESFAQMDSYSEFFQNQVPFTISSGHVHKYKG